MECPRSASSAICCSVVRFGLIIWLDLQAICFCGYVRRRRIFRRPARLRTESGARFICIPMSRASIRFSANERRRSSSVLVHGLVVKSSCSVIWTSPSPEFQQSGACYSIRTARLWVQFVTGPVMATFHSGKVGCGQLQCIQAGDLPG
jgi:hypothetical protein